MILGAGEQEKVPIPAYVYAWHGVRTRESPPRRRTDRLLPPAPTPCPLQAHQQTGDL